MISKVYVLGFNLLKSKPNVSYVFRPFACNYFSSKKTFTKDTYEIKDAEETF